MALEPHEVELIKHHLGYGDLTILALPYIETALVFEQVVQGSINATGEDRVRNQFLPQIKQVEQDIFDARTRYKLSEIPGDVKINDREHEKLVQLREWLLDGLSMAVRVRRAKKLNTQSEVEVT